jgi:hypothetical protein
MPESCNNPRPFKLRDIKGAPNGRREFTVGRPHRAVYDRDLCISVFQEKREIDRDEAEKRFESEVVWNLFNHWQDGPIFVEVLKRKNLSACKAEDCGLFQINQPGGH